MATFDNEVMVILMMNMLDQLIDKLTEKGLLTAEDFSALIDATIAQVRDAGNPKAGAVEAALRQMYGAKQS